MTLVVLGLDALDTAQIEHFENDEFKLNSFGRMESVAHQLDWPHTGEVWPTIATGLHPREHGITMSGESQWNNPLIEFASKFTGRLPNNVRGRLGRIATKTTGADWRIAETNAATIFDAPGRVVHDWPGVYRSVVLERVWKTINHANDESIPEAQFDRDLMGVAAEQFGWVREMLDHNVSLVATHCHLLDASGHAYRFNEDHYRRFYDKAAKYVQEIRDAMRPGDEMLILSDHGMRTAWLDDEPIGVHSWRAVSASTSDNRPESVFEVKEWVEEHIVDIDQDETAVDLPEDHLRELGYIE